MGMPRKGSRKVELEGVSYLWRVKRIEDLLDGTPRIRLTVQRDEERPGRVMQTELTSIRHRPAFTGRRAGVWVDEKEQLSALTSEDVRLVITHALKNGWNPGERGAAFVFSRVLELPEFRC